MKKVLCMVLAFVLVLGMYSFASAEEPVELVMNVEADVGLDPTNLLVFKTLEERLGVKLTINAIPSGDYETKQTTALTTFEMGDIWSYRGNAKLNEYGDMGAFVNLYDYEDELPATFAMYAKYQKEVDALASAETGKLYGFYRIYDFPYANEGLMIRADIVEKLGYSLDEIVTMDDFTEVLYAMKEAYPDTTPLIGRWGLSYMIYLGLRAANTDLGVAYDIYNNEYSYGPITDAMKTVVTWYHQLAEDGIFDYNFGITDAEWKSKLITGNAFCCYDYANESDNRSVEGKAYDPDFQLTAIRLPSFDGSGKTRPLSAWSVYSDRCFAIPSNSKNIEKALEFCDYLYSEEGAVLTVWGIEGETFMVNENGRRVYMEPIKTVYNQGTTPKTEYGLGWSTELVRVYLSDAYTGGFTDWTSKALDATHADSTPSYNFPSIKWTNEESELRASIKTPLDTYCNEQITKFIIGERNIDEWDKYVQYVKDTFDVDTLVSMQNEKIGK